jgi:parallel beta-helix repeat protein
VAPVHVIEAIKAAGRARQPRTIAALVVAVASIVLLIAVAAPARPGGQPSPTVPANVAAADPTVAPPTVNPTELPSVPTVTPSPTLRPTPTPTPQNEFYVDPRGNDSASGTLDRPWRTLAHAAQAVPAGATVFIRAGTYDAFTISVAGGAAAPTRFVAYPGEKPIVDGRGKVDYTIRFVGAAHVTLNGLRVTGGSDLRQNGGGISIENSAQITIADSEIHHNRAFGVRILDSTDVLVEDNDIHDNATGVRITAARDGVVIRDNTIHDNNQMMVNTADVFGDDAGGDGVAIVSGAGQVLVEGNQLWRNRAQSFDYGYDGGAFSVYAASNWTIRDNRTWDNRNVLETGTDAEDTPCDNGRFVRNLNYGATTVDRTVGVVLRCASNTIVANNTFYGLQYFVFDISDHTASFGGSIEGLQVVNNVVSISDGKVYGLESALPASVVIDYNVVHDSGAGYFATNLSDGYTTFAEFQLATGLDVHSSSADPRFKAPRTGDFTLTAGSPAIDRGIQIAGVTDVFDGLRPDCGYVEAALP